MSKTDLLRSGIAFEQAAIGMALVDFDGTFLEVNPALCELVGRSERELLGVTWQSITHRDDVGPGEREVAKTAQGVGRTFRLPKRYVRPDGGVAHVLLTVSLISGDDGEGVCLLTQVVDMSEQRRAAEGLARLASIVESSDDAIVSTDLTGTILSWNRGAERMYGYAASEMVGQSTLRIIPPDRMDEGARLLESIRSGGSVTNFDTVRRRRDASTVAVSVTLSPIFDESGAAVAASSIDRDITAQTRMTAELDRTVLALEGALADARDSEARSRKFLRDAAHHLRNPLAGVRACAETLLRGVEADASDRLLMEMARETAHLGQLIDRLLRLARLEQDDPLMAQRRDIVELCQAEVERSSSLAPHLIITVAPHGPLLLAFDVDAVHVILANVLDNVRRHARRRVEVRVIDRSDVVLVRIRDDGPGLAAGAEALAFEPFVSLDGMGGSGLGLTLSRRLAQAHGGDLTYEDGAFVLCLRQLPGVAHVRASVVGDEFREPSADEATSFRES